jgi:large subunit ribosomal protein L17
VSTTIEKAKDVRSFAEKLITLAKKGDLASRRKAISMLGNRDIVVEEDGIAVAKGTIVGKLFSELGPRYLGRPGGYTRIVRLQLRRLGDNGQLVLLQLVGADEKPDTRKKKERTKKQKAATPAAQSGELSDQQEGSEPAEAGVEASAQEQSQEQDDKQQ